MERTVIPVNYLTQHHELPGIALRDPWMTMNAPEPGKVVVWLNGSSIAHKGKRWMTYRTECKRWFMWSKLNIVQLDENFVPIPGTNSMLPLYTRFDGWNAEDGRLFVFRDRLHLAYGDGHRMLLAELSDEGEVVRSMAVPTDEPDKNPPYKYPREKNWGFFEFDGRLFCQHKINPTVTLEFDQNWKVIKQWSVSWRYNSNFGTNLHGGSLPVFHDNLLWRWVHCHRVEQLPHPWQWFTGKTLQHGHRYYPHLMCFEPEPPFQPISISTPVFHTNWEPISSDGPTPHSVVFVGSARREGEGWRIFYGENDRRIATTRVLDNDIKMKEVEKSKPRKVKPHEKNFLHFIWLQGEDVLPAEDRENIVEWKIENLDWTVKIWDDSSLDDIIQSKAPIWMKVWKELKDLRKAKPNDVALVAKASDLARLILLSIRFSGEQQWNVYADTDTRPYRPLTDFFRDNVLHGMNIPKNPYAAEDAVEREWDPDNYELLVSEENLLNPNRGVLTNAVIMARPGSFAVTYLLKEGIATRKQSTLKAWGPIMLRKTVEDLKRSVAGRRVFVMPFHYFVWNPTQMQNHPPHWSVCSHLNKFRWRQEGISTSIAGSDRAKMNVT